MAGWKGRGDYVGDAGRIGGIQIQVDVSPEPAIHDESKLGDDRGEHEDQKTVQDNTAESPTTQISCGLDIPNDLFLSLKTGATEIHRKLPIHLLTTLSCLSPLQYKIYSDLPEQITPSLRAHDILSNLSSETKKAGPEWSMYHKIQAHASDGHGLWDMTKEEEKTAWTLDKWKFLPMLEDALESAPTSTKWFLFVEADTYVSLSNMGLWLEEVEQRRGDPRTMQLYLGGQSFIGGRLFGHGGSGYVVSRAALESAVSLRHNDVAHWDSVTRDEWAGDLVVSLLLHESNVSLTKSWPTIQGETPASLDYTKKHWCSPVVSWHHVDAEEVWRLWTFEQTWYARQQASSNSTDNAQSRRTPIRHKDIFNALLSSEITADKSEWDNTSHDWEESLPAPFSSSTTLSPGLAADLCRAKCLANSECVQFTYLAGSNGKLEQRKCTFAKELRFGKRQEASSVEKEGAFVSGWMKERFEESVKEWESDSGSRCQGEDAQWMVE